MGGDGTEMSGQICPETPPYNTSSISDMMEQLQWPTLAQLPLPDHAI